MLAGASVVREAFQRTVRIVTTARLRAGVLEPLVDSQDELAQLAELESATSARLMGQNTGSSGIAAAEYVYGVPHAHFINASFAYAKPFEPGRFNSAERGAWYSAISVDTALAEVVFHMTENLAATGSFHAVVEYAEMFASFAGEFLDLRGIDPASPCLHPNKSIGYPAGNAIADHTRSMGLNGIIYPSVRHSGGTCIVALWPLVVQSAAQGCVFRVTWSGEPRPMIEKVDAELT